MQTFEGFGFAISADGAFRRTRRTDTLTVNEARQASSDAILAMQTIRGITGKRALTVEERSAFDGLDAFAGDVAGRRAKVEASAEAERLMTAVADPDAQAAQRSAARAGIRGDAPFTGAAMDAPRGRRFVDLFGAHALQSDGWSSREEFLAALHTGRADDRLRAGYAPPRVGAIASGSNGADGGFSVPTQYAAEWLDASLESEIVRSRAVVWPMTSDNRQAPGFDASDSSTTLFGGFSGQWLAPGQEITAQTPKLRAITLQAKKLGLLTEVTNELIRDGIGYEAQLGVAIQKAIGWFFDLAFLFGTGAGQPLGIMNSTVLITVTKEVGQAAATILYENLVNMFARLHPGSLATSVWLANPTTIPQLAMLQMAIGAGGSAIPVMSNTNGDFTILTRPVIFTEKVPALGSKGDIILADFSQYTIGLRADVSLEKSNAPGFTRDTSHYRGIMRADGQPTWNTSYTPKNGSALSPFVTLEART